MNQSLLGFFLLSIAIFGGVGLYSKHLDLALITSNKDRNYKNSDIFQKKLKLNSVWKTDIQRLIEEGQIPQAWNKIHQVIFIATDPPTQKLSRQLIAPVVVNPEGLYRLEITIISHQSEQDQTQILLQHNLVELENDNTIWELNRTYNLKD